MQQHNWKHEASYGPLETYRCTECRTRANVYSAKRLDWNHCPGRPLPTKKRGIEQADLYYQDWRSDKEYHIWIEQVGYGQYRVNFSFGKRGGNLLEGTKTPDRLVPLWRAENILSDVVAEKEAKGYERL